MSEYRIKPLKILFGITSIWVFINSILFLFAHGTSSIVQPSWIQSFCLIPPNLQTIIKNSSLMEMTPYCVECNPFQIGNLEKNTPILGNVEGDYFNYKPLLIFFYCVIFLFYGSYILNKFFQNQKKEFKIPHLSHQEKKHFEKFRVTAPILECIIAFLGFIYFYHAVTMQNWNVVFSKDGLYNIFLSFSPFFLMRLKNRFNTDFWYSSRPAEIKEQKIEMVFDFILMGGLLIAIVIFGLIEIKFNFTGYQMFVEDKFAFVFFMIVPFIFCILNLLNMQKWCRNGVIAQYHLKMDSIESKSNHDDSFIPKNHGNSDIKKKDVDL